MRILVIDGQGGRLGREVVSAVRAAFPDAYIRVCGTNSVSTATMLKAGANEGATGENPVTVACRDTDFIIDRKSVV